MPIGRKPKRDMKEEKENPLVKKLEDAFPGAVVAAVCHFGETSIVVKKESLTAICGFLKDDPALCFDYLSDLCGVDYLGKKDPRFEVVYQLYSTKLHERIRLKVEVADGESIPTVSTIWATANWFERECWEMFGIEFSGHPNLSRLLTIEEFGGFPLRKDFPLMGKTEIVAGYEGGVEWRKRE